MHVSGSAEKAWRILFGALCIKAIFAIAGSLIPYTALVSWLGKLESDSSFDSLSMVEYSYLVTILRGLALLLMTAALGLWVWRSKMTPWLTRKIQELHGWSFRRELSDLRAEIFGVGSDRVAWITVAMLTLAGLAIRLIQIERPVGYDEAYTFIHFASRPIRYIVTDYSAPNNHIFHSLMVYLSYHLFGNHIWTLRLPALVAGVLSIPAAFLVGRRLYDRWAGVLGGLGIALAPMLVSYSANGRGYSLTVLFSLLALWIAAYLLNKGSSLLGWFLLTVITALGFYTIPIFLYPAGAVYLWLLLSTLAGEYNSKSKRGFLAGWFTSGVAAGLLTVILYSPVIVFGSGFSSIVGNEFVQSSSWIEFLPSLIARLGRIWQEWNSRIPDGISWMLVIGFGIHILVERLIYRRWAAIWLVSAGWIWLAVSIQRVTPWPRVWLFLLAWYLVWSAAGWSSIAQIMSLRYKWNPNWGRWLLLGGMISAVVLGFFAYKADPTINQSDEDNYLVETSVFLSQHLSTSDTLVGVSPVPIQLGYYLTGLGIPFERFYDRDRPISVKHALVVVVEKSKFPTLEAVLLHQRLENTLDIPNAVEVFRYKRAVVYAIPGKE